MKTEIIIKELAFKAIRSSGPGGQHVNKVSSKIMLSFNVINSEGLSEDEKELLNKKWKSRLTNLNNLNLSCDENRSQHRNKEIVIERFLTLLKAGLTVPKSRRLTKPRKGSIKRKKESKVKQSQKKNLRKRPDID